MLSEEELAEMGMTKQDAEDLRFVVSTEGGRRFMYRLLNNTGLYVTSYDPDQPSEKTFFNEGKRNVGLRQTAELQSVAPGSFIKMVEEHQDVD